MTIQEYEKLTGLKVDESDVNRIKAVIRRCESRLGAKLGYSLSRQKTWTERGKVQYDGLIPFPSLPVSDKVLDKLMAPDEQTGDYQLFNFDRLDEHIRINPAREVYRVKIVLPIGDGEFITVYDLKNGVPYINQAGLTVAITKYYSWFTWTWYSLLSYPQQNLMIAVDADYVDVCSVSDDLAYLLADMVTYYSDENYSLMGNIKSESVDSHSYSRATTGKTMDEMAPEGQADARRVIEMYAGPGAFRKLVA